MWVPKGLEGVIVASTELTKIDGQAGRLIYRGYDATELAGNVPYEAVAHLLWLGGLPAEAELLQLREKLGRSRALPVVVEDFLHSVAKVAEPLSVLQTSVSILGGLDSTKSASTVNASIALTARMPTIVASFNRFRHNASPLQPRADLSHAANYLYMLTGKEPRPEHVRALDSYFTLLADHGLGASTFVARVAASTLTDVYSAVVAAISALKGPLHGGAPIYVKRLAKELVKPDLFHLASTVESEARELLREDHPNRVIDTNVEFYSSLVLDAVGIPPELFTCTFACARSVGWTAHIVEQRKDNRLFRPESEYKGPADLDLHGLQKTEA
ncbi:citrate/2-methylcitrate synthase [Candidatus Bathyarchaeota archaeon]|nr:MAG: citrate/2-methylcitrate synthase [Candidatus Bathyarchaeota archaeon]